MASRVTCGSFAAATETGTQAIALPTGFGTPVAVAFFWTSHADLADPPASKAHAVFGMGLSDGTNHETMNLRSRNNRANTNSVTHRAQSSTGTTGSSIIDLINGAGGGTLAEAEFVSFTADTITIDWQGAGSLGKIIGYKVWAGADVSVKVGTFTTSATQDAATTRSTVGFQAQELLTFTTYDTIDDTNRNKMQVSLGMTSVAADGTPTTRSVNWFQEQGSATQSFASYFDTSYSGRRLDSTGSNEAFELDNFTASGWDDSPRLAAVATTYAYLAVELTSNTQPDGKVSTYTAPTTNIVSGESDIARPHTGLMFMSYAQTADTLETGAEAGVIGITGWGLASYASDAKEYFSLSTGGEDARSPSFPTGNNTSVKSIGSDLYPVYMLNDDITTSAQTGDSGSLTHTDGVWADIDTLDDVEWKFDWHNTTGTWGGGLSALMVTSTMYDAAADLASTASVSFTALKIALKDASTEVASTASLTTAANQYRSRSASVDSTASAADSANQYRSRTATATTTASLTTAANQFRSRTAELSNIATVVATESLLKLRDASTDVTAAVSLTTAANQFRSRTATATTTATAATAANQFRSRTSTLTTTGVVEAEGVTAAVIDASTTLTSTASVTPTVSVIWGASSIITSAASVAATALRARYGTTTVQAAGDLATTALRARYGTTTVTTAASVDTTADLVPQANVLDGTTTVTTTGGLDATRKTVRPASATVTTTGALEATEAKVTAVNTVMTTGGHMLVNHPRKIRRRSAAAVMEATAAVLATPDLGNLLDATATVTATADLNVQAARVRFSDFIIETAASLSATATGGDAVITQYGRIQEALLDAIEAATFPVVRYNRDTNRATVADLEVGHPTSIHAEEVSSSFADARRLRTSSRLEKTLWPWEVQIHFSRKVALELFEDSVVENPPTLSRTVDLPQQVRLLLRSSRYTHPLRQDAPGGTRAIFQFEAELSPV
jgi:hypothetical protein